MIYLYSYEILDIFMEMLQIIIIFSLHVAPRTPCEIQIHCFE